MSTENQPGNNVIAALTWLDEFVEEPEYFPGDGDRAYWIERRQGIRDLAKKLLLSEHSNENQSAPPVSQTPLPRPLEQEQWWTHWTREGTCVITCKNPPAVTNAFNDHCAQRIVDAHNTSLRALQEELKVKTQALIRLRDCDWIITPHDRMDAVRDIARKALEEKEA